MVLRLCSQRSAILRAARLSLSRSLSEHPLVIGPAEPLPFSIARWFMILPSEVIHCGHFCVRNYPKPQNLL
jgi:hypothetical protein